MNVTPGFFLDAPFAARGRDERCAASLFYFDMIGDFKPPPKNITFSFTDRCLYRSPCCDVSDVYFIGRLEALFSPFLY